jgi:hypothetical protein
MFFILINLYINIRIYLVDAKFFVREGNSSFAIFGRNGYSENNALDIRIYGIGRKRCTRVEGCSSAAKGSDTPYMDSGAHGSIAYIIPHIYGAGTARSLHTKGIGISLLHIP